LRVKNVANVEIILNWLPQKWKHWAGLASTLLSSAS